MTDRTVKITCTADRSTLNLYPQSDRPEESAFVGSDLCTVRSFLYFDIARLQIPADAIIRYAILRIYLNKVETDYPISKLFVVPLFNNFREYVTPDNPPYFIDNFTSVDISRNYKGWFAIDIPEILSLWLNGGLRNNGLALLTKGRAAPDPSFLADNGCNALKPTLFLGYSFDCPPPEHAQSQIEVKELCHRFRFNNEAFTPPVNVGRIKLATFFVTNSCITPLSVTLETSANRCNWVKDCARIVCAGGTEAIVGKYYGKYYRLRLASEGRGEANVQFIAQLIN